MTKIKSFQQFVVEAREFANFEVDQIAATLGINFNEVDRNQFTLGLKMENSEHNSNNELNTVHDNFADLGKIVLAHLREVPDYYSKISKLEE